MIRAENLVKVFPGPVQAVADLSFDVAPGEIYGLLGPNGAGKTTAMRLLSALLRPTSGSALVAGYSVTDEADEVRARVGILTEVPGLYTRLTPLEYLTFFADLHAVENTADRVEELLRLVGLWDRRRTMMRTFSKGMQQRVAIARALVHDPPVLLFDEPTATLDPEAAHAIRDYVRQLAAERHRTVLLCTHNLYEAEQLCNRLSIVKNGRQVVEGSPSELRAGLSSLCVLKVRERTPLLIERLSALTEIDSVRLDGPGTITYRARHAAEANPLVIRAAVQAGADVIGLGESTASLEEAYLQLVNRP